MITKKQMAGIKLAIFTGLLTMAHLVEISFANRVWADSPFHIDKNPEGLILPFKAVSVPLSDFVREYARISQKIITTGGDWDEDLKGLVTLFLRHPLKQDDFTEVFHRVIGDNGYSVVDAPAQNGWVVASIRLARDLALPVYEAAQVPDTSRLVTAYYNLKHTDAESVAKVIRSFTPAQSRIVPTSLSQIFITDMASNILKVNKMISKMDTEEGAKRQRSAFHAEVSAHNCGEQRIEKLIVENIEIQDSNAALSSQFNFVKTGAKK